MSSRRRIIPPLLAMLWSLAGLATGCGSAPPAPTRAADDGSRATGEGPDEEEGSGGGADQAGSDAPEPARCYEPCAKRIAKADKLLDRARAAGDAPNVAVLFSKAGDQFIQAWRGCDLRQPAGTDRGCPGADTIVSHMASAFEQAKRDDGMIFAFLVALDERWRMAGSDAERRASDELAQVAARAEQRARHEPKTAGVADGLAAAAYARLALGDSTQAAEDAQQFQRLYARKQRAEVALLAVALAGHYGAQGDWPQALAAVGPATRPAAAAAPFVTIPWHAARGQALAALGRAAQARQEFSQVLRRWQPNPAQIAQSVGRAKPSPMVGREQVVDAVGAAHVFQGDQLRRRADGLEMPTYRGQATVKDVNHYVRTEVARWAQKRHAVVLEADQAYRRVAQIKPVPPPRQVVVATAAMGALWASFAGAFTASPMPAHVAGDPELRSAWSNATDEASAPLTRKARAAYRACDQTARHHRIRGEHAQRCAAWLSEHPEP